MKIKILTLLLVVLVIAGCNKEKLFKEKLAGTWRVYKYLLYNVDKTTFFQNTYQDYKITFTEGGEFTEYYSSSGDSILVNGTYSFDLNDDKLTLEHNYFDVTDSSTKTLKRRYTVFNLTEDHVQLRTDTSQLYMDTLML